MSPSKPLFCLVLLCLAWVCPVLICPTSVCLVSSAGGYLDQRLAQRLRDRFELAALIHSNAGTPADGTLA